MIRKFTASAAQSFGESSLMLSSGTAMGLYHWGIVRALLAEDLSTNAGYARLIVMRTCLQ